MRIHHRTAAAACRLTAVVCLLLAGAVAAHADSAYVRQPDLHGDLLVFCAESDLWLMNLNDGVPRRLTTHPGNESNPSFSPDGRSVAFTGAYDGNTDVYIIPVEGGEPRRLTWHPGDDQMVDWWPDGRSVVVRSRRSDHVGNQHLFTVDLEGGDPQELPLGWASRIAVDEQTGRWAFIRNNRENRPWKRYRGGWASDIWVGDPERADFRKVTDFDGMDHFPMWHDGRIYFLSDKGGTANIWSITPDGGDRRRHTRYDKWDIRWPAQADDGRIVFTLAADVHIFDPATGDVDKVDIDLGSDRLLTRVRYPNAGRSISEVALTPEGDRLAVIARGEVFSVPVEKGVTYPVTRGTGARERSVIYHPDGDKLLYITDEKREEEVRVQDAWGRGEAETVLSAEEGVWHYQPEFSPDGKRLAYSDNSYGLFVTDADGGGRKEVDRGTKGEIRNYTWSPDGRWLAYTKALPNDFSSIFIYDAKEEEIHEVTDPYTNDYSPAWDPEGRYLYFVSDRNINPLIGELDFNNVEIKNDRIYMVLLREDVENPLLDRKGMPPADEEEKEDAGDSDDAEASDDETADKDEDAAQDGDKADDDKEDGDDKDAPAPVEIEFAGLQDRVVELPIPNGTYRGLNATAGNLFYVNFPVRGLADSGDFFNPGPAANQNQLMTYSLADKEASVFLENVAGYVLAAKGGKIAVFQQGTIYVVATAAPPGPALAKGAVDMSDLVVELDPRQEWEQIFYEAWRQMREFYWDEEMSGVDWDGIRDQYAKLLPRLASRADLSDLLAEVFGEMNTSHTYVWGGDPGVRVGRVASGLLGADLVRAGDEAYRIERILRGGAPDRVRSPLDVPGVDIKEGEFILAVNRRPVTEGRPWSSYLENLAGKETILTVNDEPDMDGSREVVVTPLGSDQDLRYADWVRRNREYVLEQTDGKIGYIHVPDMLSPGLIEFNTWFYPQLDKEGLVVDMRWNGGGSYSQMMLERLRRHVLSWSYTRGGATHPYPYRVLNGPFVVLVNEGSGSDGDIFPQAVQLEGLAPIIGTRTWGGVNGITAIRPLVDGGLVTQSQVAWWDKKDDWGLENRGVLPDIEVPALPQDIAQGVDKQLDAGIAEVLRLHSVQPPEKPDFPRSMRRSRKAYEQELGR